MKVAVVGHVEWVQFALIDRVTRAGEFAHARDSWCEAAGGGGVSAAVLQKLTGDCTLFTAFGNDEIGHNAKQQLEGLGVKVHASFNPDSGSNYTFCQIDRRGERTGTIINDLEPSRENGSLPWHKLAEMDAVYFVSGDEAALRFARRARILVSTARILPLLQSAKLPLDALVMSANDPTETYRKGDLEPLPKLAVRTNGRSGENANGHVYPAEIVKNDDFADSYGCGDSFAAGLTYGLARNLPVEDTLKLAAHEGAEAAKRRGAYGIF